MTDTTNTNAAHAAALAMRNAAAALARRRPLYDGASGESADEDLAQAIEDLPLPDVDVTDWQAEAERDAALAELSEQVAFAARHLAIISGVLGSPEPIEIDDIAARLHLLIAERDELAARLEEIERAEPVMWMARKADGRIAAWPSASDETIRLAREIGTEVRPLYACPQPSRRASCPRGER